MDTNAPTAGAFSINTGANSTKSTGVWVTNITGIDNWTPLQMRFSNNGTARSGWMQLNSITGWTLPISNGTATVYMQLADAGGNMTTNITDTILLDTTGPTIEIFPPSTTVSSMVIVTITGSDTGVGIQSISYQTIVGSGNCPSTGYITYPASFMLPGLPDETITRKVCAYGTDTLGNSGQVMSGVYVIDNEPPHGNFIINS